MNKNWTWNHGTYPFDVSEAGCMGRLLAALEGLRANLAGFRREQDADDMLSCHCGILQEFFDDIFGDGAGRNCAAELSVRKRTPGRTLTLWILSTHRSTS